MPHLEERLFHCLEANLRDRDEVIASNGSFIDAMRRYCSGPALNDAFATALNIYRKNYFVNERYDFVTPDDIGIYTMFHTEKNLDYYEQIFKLKSFMFALGIPEQKWGALKAKLGMPAWSGGFFLPQSRFQGFFHRSLLFNTYGLELICNPGALYHEALHCDRRMYSANSGLIDWFNVNPDYKPEEWAAKAEMVFVDEIGCYLCDGRSRRSIKRLMKGRYMDRTFSFIMSMFKDLKKEDTGKKKKDISRILSGVKSSMRAAVNASSYIRQRLSPELLVPLFYSLGPTSEEIAKKEFRPPFEDILLWAKLLQQDRIRPAAIREALQKRHYCPN